MSVYRFDRARIPREVALGPFRLTVLTIDDVMTDYIAVMESAAYLGDLFGDGWPESLTIRQNLVDLGWHENEFSRRTSFAWVIREADGTYAGCAYLRMSGENFERLVAHHWFRASFTNGAAMDEYDREWRTFVADHSTGPAEFHRRSVVSPKG